MTEHCSAYHIERLWERYPLGFSAKKFGVTVKTHEIMSVVSIHTGVSIDDMKGRKVQRHISRARHIAQYLCATMTSASYPEIGRRFDRDHTSVLHAYRKIKNMLEHPDEHYDAMLERDIVNLRAMVTELAQTKSGCALMESST